jgi:hypothetical protein
MRRLYAVQAEGKKIAEKVPTQSRSRKQDREYEDNSSVNKKEVPENSRPLPLYQNSRSVASRNFIASMRTIAMKGAEPSSEGSSSTPHAKESLDKDSPSPIILTTEANLISLQKQIKSVVNWEFLFRNTATGNGFQQKNMADSKAIQTSCLLHVLHKSRKIHQRSHQALAEQKFL